MANYEVDPELLRFRVPAGTELDLFDGRCFVSLVGFMFLNTRVLGIPVPFRCRAADGATDQPPSSSTGFAGSPEPLLFSAEGMAGGRPRRRAASSLVTSRGPVLTLETGTTPSRFSSARYCTGR